ncbi:hypothetical protein GmHk_04G010767 [Glycine max]|nr:hypothetical protein GmHk_04G010767 [Glycine max]
MTMTQDHEKLDSNLIATCVVAYTPCKHVFDQNLEKFHQLSPAIARWIDRISKEKWSMAYDTSGRRYGHMTTNLSECVNKVLKDCRSIPITALVKSTYSRCRKYFVDRGRQAQRQLREGQVYCSKLVTELGKNREQACSYIVRVYDIHLTRFECFVSHLDATLTSSVGPECVEFISIVQRAISGVLELGHDIAVKGSLWAMKTEVVFPQHHRTIAGLQKYQCDDPEKDTDTSVSDAQQMFVACNTFHGHAPAFFGNILPFQQSPFVCLCPEFQHLTEVCETVVWEIDAQMQDHVTLAQ